MQPGMMQDGDTRDNGGIMSLEPDGGEFPVMIITLRRNESPPMFPGALLTEGEGETVV